MPSLVIIATTGLRTVLGKRMNGWIRLKSYVLTTTQPAIHSRVVKSESQKHLKNGKVRKGTIYNKLSKHFMGLVVKRLRVLANKTWGM